MKSTKNALLLALFCTLPFASNLPAQVSSMDFLLSGTGLSGTVTVPQFNPNLGLLEGIILNENFSTQVNYSFANGTTNVLNFNPNPFPPNSGHGSSQGSVSSDFYTGGSGGAILYFDSPSMNISVPAGSIYTGVGGPITTYGTTSGSYTIANSYSAQILGNTPFIGTGTVNLNYLNSLLLNNFNNPESLSGSFALAGTNTSFNADLTFYYLPVPEPSATAFIGISGGMLMFLNRMRKLKSRQD